MQWRPRMLISELTTLFFFNREGDIGGTQYHSMKKWQYCIYDWSHILKIVSMFAAEINISYCKKMQEDLTFISTWNEKRGHCMHKKFHCILTVRNRGIVCHDV